MPTTRRHDEAARGIDDVHLRCRDLRHTWEVVGFYRHDGGVRRLLDCSRCGTQRLDLWRLSGERETSRYSYAPDYRVEGGVEAAEVRHEVMRRAKVYKDEAHMIHALAASGSVKVPRGGTQ